MDDRPQLREIVREFDLQVIELPLNRPIFDSAGDIEAERLTLRHAHRQRIDRRDLLLGIDGHVILHRDFGFGENGFGAIGGIEHLKLFSRHVTDECDAVALRRRACLIAKSPLYGS